MYVNLLYFYSSNEYNLEIFLFYVKSAVIYLAEVVP